jgi:N utilization substance protein B
MLETAAEYETFRLGKEIDGEQYREADAAWFRNILSGVVNRQKQLDPVLRNALTDDWPLSRLDSTLRAILRAGAYELTSIKDLPPAVVISEYVDIARAFYEEGEEPRMVNAVLDRIAKSLREAKQAGDS